jgi:hypothetical protein
MKYEFLFGILLIILLYMTTEVCAFHSLSSRMRIAKLQMKGRSPDEVGMSKRQMFISIRNQMREAMKNPAFLGDAYRPTVSNLPFPS